MLSFQYHLCVNILNLWEKNLSLPYLHGCAPMSTGSVHNCSFFAPCNFHVAVTIAVGICVCSVFIFYFFIFAVKPVLTLTTVILVYPISVGLGCKLKQRFISLVTDFPNNFRKKR